MSLFCRFILGFYFIFATNILVAMTDYQTIDETGLKGISTQIDTIRTSMSDILEKKLMEHQATRQKIEEQEKNIVKMKSNVGFSLHLLVTTLDVFIEAQSQQENEKMKKFEGYIDRTLKEVNTHLDKRLTLDLSAEEADNFEKLYEKLQGTTTQLKKLAQSQQP